LEAIELARRLGVKIAAERQNPQNSLLFSLLAGNLVRRLVRSWLHPQPASPVSAGHVRFAKIRATFPRVGEPWPSLWRV